MMRALLLTVAVLGLTGCGSSKLVDKDLQPAELGKLVAQAQLSQQAKTQLACKDLGYLPQMQPVIDGAELYLACGREVAVLDAQTLKIQRSITLANEASSGVVKVGNDVYVGSLNGFVYRLNAQDLSIQNKFQFESEVSALSVGEGVVAVRTQEGKLTILESDSLTQRWAYTRKTPELSMRGMSPAMIVGNRVYLGLDQGRLIAFELDSGRTLWERVLSMSTGVSDLERLVDIDANLQQRDGVLTVLAYQGRLAQVDMDNGGVRWYKAESSLNTPALGQHLFVVDDESTVKAYHPQTGNVVWQQKALHHRQLTAPVVWNQAVWTADFDGFLHGLNTQDGALMARMDLSNSLAMPIVVEGDSMYVMTVDGVLSRLSVKR